MVFLGTGAAIPSKYRNVTGIYLNFFARGGMLVDCGEGSYGQLKRRFGCRAEDVVKNLKCIWISHIHADHHAGITRQALPLMSKPRKGRDARGRATSPVLFCLRSTSRHGRHPCIMMRQQWVCMQDSEPEEAAPGQGLLAPAGVWPTLAPPHAVRTQPVGAPLLPLCRLLRDGAWTPGPQRSALHSGILQQARKCRQEGRVRHAAGARQGGQSVWAGRAGHQQAGELHGGPLRECVRTAAGVGGWLEAGLLRGHQALHERGAGSQERADPHPRGGLPSLFRLV